jgi:hypothetical protein
LDYDGDLLLRIIVLADGQNQRLRSRADSVRHDRVDLKHPRDLKWFSAGEQDFSGLASDRQ